MSALEESLPNWRHEPCFSWYVGIYTNFCQNLALKFLKWFAVTGITWRATRHFLRQWRFCRIRAHWQKFCKRQEKKGPAGKILEFFLLDTLKTIFWMEYLTQRWTHYLNFFPQNQGTFFDFQIRAGEASPSPSLACITVSFFWPIKRSLTENSAGIMFLLHQEIIRLN